MLQYYINHPNALEALRYPRPYKLRPERNWRSVRRYIGAYVAALARAVRSP